MLHQQVLHQCLPEAPKGLMLRPKGLSDCHIFPIYNGLPAPAHRAREEKSEKTKIRRRILTNAVAVPPEIREEDWY